MLLHFLVIAALSDCDNSHLCTVPGFIENPIRPPFVFESRFAVCSIVWSQAIAEKPWLFRRCTAKFDEISGRIPITNKDNVEY